LKKIVSEEKWKMHFQFLKKIIKGAVVAEPHHDHKYFSVDIPKV